MYANRAFATAEIVKLIQDKNSSTLRKLLEVKIGKRPRHIYQQVQTCQVELLFSKAY